MRKLLYDIRANNDTGVSRYGISLLKSSIPYLLDAGWSVIVTAYARQYDRALEAAGNHPRVHVVSAPYDDKFVRRSQWMRDLITERRPDLFYTSHYAVDRECQVPFVLTVHDLNRIIWPQFSYTDKLFIEQFGWDEYMVIRRELHTLKGGPSEGDEDSDVFTEYFTALTQYLVARATRIVTVSRASRSDLVSWLGVVPERIELMPCGVDDTTFHPRSRAEVNAVRRRFGIPGPYLLYVGLNHPSKRVCWLTEQLLAARDAMPTNSRLVIAGGHADTDVSLRRILLEAGGEEFVTFTGRVTDDELASLYTGASASVSASLCEGSGLPAQEAANCGCEVVATDIAAFRETVGHVAHLFPPDRGDLLAKLAAAATWDKLARQATAFAPASWDASGCTLANMLGKISAHDGRPPSTLKAS